MKVFTLGTGGKGGWAAIDEFTLTREGEGCQILPPEAFPSTTTPSLSSTTPPPDEDLGCTFQENLCGFTVNGDEGFVFRRSNGSQVTAIGADHNFDESGVFLYAESPAVQDPTPVRIQRIPRDYVKFLCIGVHLHYVASY